MQPRQPQSEPEFATIYNLKCGPDSTRWPSLSCTETDETVELRTSLGDVAILTGTTPTERLRIGATGLVQVQGSLSVSKGITVGGKQVIDSSGKWTGPSAWVDGANRVTTASQVGIGVTAPEHALQIGDAATPVTVALRGPDAQAASSVLSFESELGSSSSWFGIVHDTQAKLLKVTSAEATHPLMTFERESGNIGIGTASPGLFRLKVEGGDVGIDGNLTVNGTLRGELAEGAVSRSQLKLTLVADWEVEVKSTPNGVNFVIENSAEHAFYLASCRVVGPTPSEVAASIFIDPSDPISHSVPLIEETRRINWRHSSKLVPSITPVFPTPLPSPFDPPPPDPDTNSGAFSAFLPVTGWHHSHEVWFENLGTSSVTVAFQVYRLN